MAAIPSPPLPPPSQPELFELSFDEELGGARPAPLLEVLPQEQVQRHTVDQIVDAVPGLPTLDVLVPQMVDEPMALLMAFDFFVPEQVIKVPKISTPFRCPRTVLSVPQTAEQLVEALTIVSLIEVIRQPVEQTVGGGGGGGLPGFFLGQSYSFTAEQIVDNPVPRRGLGGGLHGLHPGQSSAATARQIVDNPVLRVAPHDFHQDLLSAAGSSDLPDTANQGFFPTGKKVRRSRAPRGRNWVRNRAPDVMSLAGVWCRWLRQHVLHDGRRLLLVCDRQEWCPLVCSSGLPPHAVARSSRWCRLCAGAACQPWRLLEEFPLLRCCAFALCGLGKSGHLSFALVSFSLFWRMGVACGEQRI